VSKFEPLDFDPFKIRLPDPKTLDKIIKRRGISLFKLSVILGIFSVGMMILLGWIFVHFIIKWW